MVLLEVETGETDPFYAHTLWLGRTSPSGLSPRARSAIEPGKVLALAYLRDASARDGLSVSILGRHRAAVILPAPPFDPGNDRLRRPGEPR